MLGRQTIKKTSSKEKCNAIVDSWPWDCRLPCCPWESRNGHWNMLPVWIHKCKVKIDPAPGELPFAKCFVCGEMGHLSISCPVNPKGLCVDGGGCWLCGSVEHLKKDCPESQTEIKWPQLVTGAKGMSADYEEILDVPKPQKPKTKIPKVVNFWWLVLLFVQLSKLGILHNLQLDCPLEACIVYISIFRYGQTSSWVQFIKEHSAIVWRNSLEKV